MDGEYIDYAAKSDFNIIKDNILHKGLLLVTTDIDMANRYAYNNENSKIFLETKVLNSIFNDNRCCEYSELDLISAPVEWIIGYFKLSIDDTRENEYTFKKTLTLKNNF